MLEYWEKESEVVVATIENGSIRVGNFIWWDYDAFATDLEKYGYTYIERKENA